MDSGRTPIIEARMSEMVAEANRAGLLNATTDATAAVLNPKSRCLCRNAELEKWQARPQPHRACAKEIGAAICQKKSPHVFVLRSTVLAGTTETACSPSLKKRAARNAARTSPFAITRVHARRQRRCRLPEPAYTILGPATPNTSRRCASFTRTLRARSTRRPSRLLKW